MTADSLDTAFEKLMKTVGNDGVFQLRYNIMYNIALVFVASIIYNSMLFTFAKQDHWCHVPGRQHLNLTDDQWKNLTVPREEAPNSFSKCQMYDINWLDVDRRELPAMLANGTFNERQVVDCRHGWEYDKEWFERTAVSQENWVCEKDMYQTNTFAYGRLGEVLGSLVFGQLGDLIGRRKMFYASIIVLLLGKMSMIFAVSNFALVAISAVVGSLASNSVFQAPILIAMETNKPEKRASIALYQNVSWSVAMCIMPLMFWVIRDWKIFFWVTTMPLLIFLCFPSYMIESPRWLATKGRLAECAAYLTTIARINGRPTDEITETYLKKILPDTQGGEQVYGMLSFFTGWRIARNTLVLVLCWVTCSLGYFTLLLSVAELPGNPFLNFLIQSLIEFPAYFTGERLSNCIGRRVTNCISFAGAAVLSFVLLMIFDNPAYATVTIALTFAVKFCVTITFFAVNLQCMETHPTCLRQTGISLGIVLANVVGMLGPYIVYLGHHYNPKYPYLILMGMFIMGTICGLFTIETYGQKVPDTLEEAMQFGKDQKFWSFPRAKKESTEPTTIENADEADKLNQLQFEP